MFQVGDKVKVTAGFYAGAEGEIAEVVAENIRSYDTGQIVSGYALFDIISSRPTKISTFWSDELEAI